MNTQPNDHIVKSYDEEQRRIVAEIVRMGETAVAQLEAALDVVERRDDKAAQRIIANDEAIDAIEHQVSHDVMHLALRGPMARDLREILAGLRIPADIERIGDYAANVAKRSIALNVSPPMPQITGLRALGKLAARQVRDVPWIVPVPQQRATTHAALQAHLDRTVRDGGEGLMLHRGSSLYRAERNDDLLKFKPHDDAEARVVAHIAGQGKHAGRLGALLVETGEGLRFKLGGGFTDAQRAAPPPIGSLVTYRYNGLNASGVPRFARFLRVREAP